MAQPGPEFQPRTRPDTKQDKVLNFRVDEELAQAVDDFAASMGGRVTRSQACRALLSAGLGQPANLIAAREALFTYQRYRHEFVGKFVSHLRGALPALLESFITQHADDDDAEV